MTLQPVLFPVAKSRSSSANTLWQGSARPLPLGHHPLIASRRAKSGGSRTPHQRPHESSQGVIGDGVDVDPGGEHRHHGRVPGTDLVPPALEATHLVPGGHGVLKQQEASEAESNGNKREGGLLTLQAASYFPLKKSP